LAATGLLLALSLGAAMTTGDPAIVVLAAVVASAVVLLLSINGYVVVPAVIASSRPRSTRADERDHTRPGAVTPAQPRSPRAP